MIVTSHKPNTDPLRVFIENQFARRSAYPIPLIGTDIDVIIEAGLAVVTTKRVFQNAESDSIEATLTFPVPIHATLFELHVRIGERKLAAKAKRKEAARATYEDAIEQGKPAVLHEEVLRGIHMLSVANIPPGEKIEVTTTWAIPLTVVAGEGHLRIPMTVGEVYGRSPLSDADDIATGGEPLIGNFSITCPDAQVRLVGGFLENGKARLQLNRPIDLVIERWQPRRLKGVAADGRSVSMLLEPSPKNSLPLSVAVLVDHSGSMGQAIGSGAHTMSKHAFVVAALRALSDRLSRSDSVDLWEFDSAARRIGSTDDDKLGLERIQPGSAGQRFRALVDRLSGPAGGTEIGDAIAATIDQSIARDILLITDGKSHALEIQALANKGRRISVILVGEDSLEANVGHLAALTGGNIFVSGGADLVELFQSAVDSLPGQADEPMPGAAAPVQMTYRRGGLTAHFDYGSDSESSEGGMLGRAVAVMAARFLLPALPEAAAAQLAESEGMVTHLTSLVLVDEAGAVQAGIPAQRKILLPEPATQRRFSALASHGLSQAREYSDVGKAPLSCRTMLQDRRVSQFDDGALNMRLSGPPETNSISDLALRIDWGDQPSRLLAGDVSQLEPDLQELIRILAERDDVKAAALKLNILPLTLVIALLATVEDRIGNRSAGRIARQLLKKVDPQQIQNLIAVFQF